MSESECMKVCWCVCECALIRSDTSALLISIDGWRFHPLRWWWWQKMQILQDRLWNCLLAFLFVIILSLTLSFYHSVYRIVCGNVDKLILSNNIEIETDCTQTHFDIECADIVILMESMYIFITIIYSNVFVLFSFFKIYA